MKTLHSRLAHRLHPQSGAWAGGGWEATMNTRQLRIPGTRPGFVRVELDHGGEVGWSVTVYEADTKRYVTAADARTYDFMSYEEAVEVVAAVLDGIDAAG